MSQVIQRARLNLSQLALSETDVAQRPCLSKVTKRLKPSVLFGPHYMNMRRAMIIRMDHRAPTLEGRENAWHGAI